MYKKVNDMLGDLVKVTPSSKMVGDMAIFMVQHDLTPENILEKGRDLSYPDSVISYFKGMMGQPAWGFPEELQKIVLKGEKPITCRPGELLPPADFAAARAHLKDIMHDMLKNSRKNAEKLREAQLTNDEGDPSDRAVISWCLYPKCMREFLQKRREYGYISRLGSHIFFHGMAPGETSQVDIEDGKTLAIKYVGLGELNDDGERAVLFELNGVRREVTVTDNSAADQVKKVPMADPDDKLQIGAQIPGAVSKIFVKKGDAVKTGEGAGRYRGHEDGDLRSGPDRRHHQRHPRIRRRHRQARRTADDHESLSCPANTDPKIQRKSRSRSKSSGSGFLTEIDFIL